MRTSVTLLAALGCPATVLAAEGPLDVAGTLVQTVASLALVIGMILVVYYLATRIMKVPQGGHSRYIRVVETRHLAPKKSLMLVEVGGEYLLLSNSGDQVSFLKQVEMLEEIEVVEEKSCGLLIPRRLREKVASFAGELPLTLALPKKNGGLT